MPTIVSLSLAGLFVFLAGFNVWNMLTGRVLSSSRTGLWTQIHRIAGYTFIALFAILCYCMLLRIKGSSDELPTRLIAHLGLALLLSPLLFVKVIVARYQKGARGLLLALGIGIFAISFTLVALNVSIHFLRAVSTHKVPFGISATFVTAVLISAGVGIYAKSKQPKFNRDTATLSLAQTPDQGPGLRGQVLTLTLVRIESQTPDAKTLRFILPRGQQIAPRPGQFLTFEWMIEGKPVIRSYSICSSPLQTGYVEITPKRVENGYVSQFLNDRATVGLTVKARGPYGKFCLDENKHRRVVLIAGGSGITPMFAMLRYIDDSCIPAVVTLIYCVRTEQDVFFRDEIAALQHRLRGFRCVLVLSNPGSDWEGWKGRLRHEIVQREVENLSDSTFFLCGPPPFMEVARSLLKGINIEPSRILQESFGGAVAGETDACSTSGSTAIIFSRSGVSYDVFPEETLLESSERNGVLIPSGCRQGVCGTCATKLLSGKVKMESEDALTDELRTQNFILPCVSRPLGDVTLDA